MDYISGRTQTAFYVGLGLGKGFSSVSENMDLNKAIYPGPPKNRHNTT
jgi:hypothetical protein